MKFKALFLLLILSMSIIPLVSAYPEWINSSWQYRNVYVIDSSLVNEELTDFPVLVHLNSSYIEWDRVNNDLSDIRFYDGYNNLLSHEIDTNIVDNEAWLWVKIPTVNNVSDTYFYMYYGCIYAESVENKTDVWSNGYVMVQHMNDNSTSTILDSTSNDNDGAKKDANEPIEAVGQIGNAQNFGGDDYISVASLDAFPDGDSALTLEAIIKFSTSQNGKGVIGWWWNQAVILKIVNDKIGFVCQTVDGAVAVYSPLTYNDGVSHHIVGTYDKDAGADNLFLYVDGQIVATDTQTNTIFATNPFTIGSINNQISGTYNFEGIIEEPRISSNVSRSSAWVGASYETQNLNLVDLVDTESFNSESYGLSLIALMIALFSFVMVIIVKDRMVKK